MLMSSNSENDEGDCGSFMGREDEGGIPPLKGVQGDVPLASFEFSPSRTSREVFSRLHPVAAAPFKGGI